MSAPIGGHRSILSLRKPGTWIELPDRKAAFDLECSLDHLGYTYGHAAAAWALFEEQTPGSGHPALQRLCSGGRVPLMVRKAPTFIYAQAFLYAADMVGRRLKTLAAEHEGTQPVFGRYSTAFPDLSEVRHSWAHVDERQRLIGKRGKPLEPKARDPQGSLVPSPVVISDTLMGNRYTFTMASGEIGQLEISVASLEIMRACIEEAFGTFVWFGSPSDCF